jgi:hypothetical protein
VLCDTLKCYHWPRSNRPSALQEAPSQFQAKRVHLSLEQICGSQKHRTWLRKDTALRSTSTDPWRYLAHYAHFPSKESQQNPRKKVNHRTVPWLTQGHAGQSRDWTAGTLSTYLGAIKNFKSQPTWNCGFLNIRGHVNVSLMSAATVACHVSGTLKHH